jgi:hypothetical protein
VSVHTGIGHGKRLSQKNRRLCLPVVVPWVQVRKTHVLSQQVSNLLGRYLEVVGIVVETK